MILSITDYRVYGLVFWGNFCCPQISLHVKCYVAYELLCERIIIYISERWVVCLCNEPMAVQSARHDSRLKFLPIT